jgi:ABC-type dipeptide/oligopeptide/nickel transport system ATPase component
VPGLEVRGLRVAFGAREVLRGVSLAVEPGSFTGLVGESGSGKSLTSLAALGLLPRGARVTDGEIRLDGELLVAPGVDATPPVRGSGIAMIFQSPRAALNPLLRVGHQIERVLRRQRVPSRETSRRAVSLLSSVGMQDAKEVARLYPHELSGGMCQRVLIAMAIANEPRILLADEPTTALDVTVQAEILDLLDELRRRTGMGTLLVSHDVSIVSERCSVISVMKDGCVVESGPTADVVRSPKQEFTAELVRDLAAAP